MKIYKIMFMIIGLFVFTGCIPQPHINKGSTVGFSIEGIHSRQTSMEIFRRGPTSAKCTAQSIALQDVVDGIDNEGFYRDNYYGRLAYIHLIFTKKGNNGVLRKVVVDWRNGARFFQAGIFDHHAVNNHYNYVASELTKKYGKQKRKGYWKPNKSTTIRLQKTVVGVKLTFIDNLKVKGNSSSKKQNTFGGKSDILSTALKIGLIKILKH